MKLMHKLRNRDLLDRFLDKKNSFGTLPTDRQSPLHSEQGASRSGNKELFYCTINNIPSSMRSKDLRRYFSDFTENGKFSCFHYRHRPEVQQVQPPIFPALSVLDLILQESTFGCFRNAFIREYHGRHWTNSEGMEIPRRCFVTAIRLAEGPEGTSDSVTAKDLRQMIELRPPSIMPQGNVGTPTKYFIEQIRLCRLPASLIPKLGLKSTRRRRKYDSVEFHYSTEDSAEYDEEGPSCSITELFQPIPTEPTERYVYAHHGPDNDSGPDDDDDQCEEWERHEALHDDVTEQDRAKPRKYEEEMEVTWEKGGPGLVWFTDKNYWDEREKGSIFLPVSLQVVNVLLASIIHYDYYVTKFLRGRHVMQPHLTSCIARN
ncbi:unnamed protein product [Heligmosomoides polygyrus]|uniref:RRM domain-containing protein n=1 Tax=Heligmosomoides polygyrus TaxID=6339 RepID=A0A183GIZ8_HELPZ|nr:unnamed protein product [Heligmosomoides polygyrus]